MGKENNEIKQTVQLQLQSASAKRLQEKLSLIKNRVELSKKRWFWELLQNASDYNDKVSVRLVVNNDKVEFYTEITAHEENLVNMTDETLPYRVGHPLIIYYNKPKTIPSKNETLKLII